MIPTDDVSSFRWLRVKNNSQSMQIPAFGLVRAVSTDVDGTVTVDRPNVDGQDVMVVGPMPIPPGGLGIATWDHPVFALYETADGTPQVAQQNPNDGNPPVDEPWGAGKDSYKLRRGKWGGHFYINGAPQTTNGISFVYVRRHFLPVTHFKITGGTYPYSWTEQIPQGNNGYQDKPNGQSGTVNIQNGTVTNGSGVITGLTSTAQLLAGMQCSGTPFDQPATIQTVDSPTQVTTNGSANQSGTFSITFPAANSLYERNQGTNISSGTYGHCWKGFLHPQPPATDSFQGQEWLFEQPASSNPSNPSNTVVNNIWIQGRIRQSIWAQTATGTINDLDDRGKSLLYMNCTGPTTLTGIKAPTDNSPQLGEIYNGGSAPLTLKDHNGGSLAINQLTLAGGKDKILQPGEGFIRKYYPATTSWLILSWCCDLPHNAKGTNSGTQTAGAGAQKTLNYSSVTYDTDNFLIASTSKVTNNLPGGPFKFHVDYEVHGTATFVDATSDLPATVASDARVNGTGTVDGSHNCQTLASLIYAEAGTSSGTKRTADFNGFCLQGSFDLVMNNGDYLEVFITNNLDVSATVNFYSVNIHLLPGQ
jgi:hypothetical protein